ncbi:MAG: hypothetical protein CMLOHMNK_03396 [Steroidobacteraceae bacterium]|nr:hypothetical protein [Steroidobacteraceae bacterium]
MSCVEGEPCVEGRKRRRALLALGLMGIIFLALSAFSFLDSRGQAVPRTVTYAGHDAIAGKRVFQAFNCMGCHTMVGNGAYFAPDLTKLYGQVGPAWLEAFLPSAGAWPTRAAVQVQLADPDVAGEAGVTGVEEYLTKFPGAAERIERRSAHASTMPNLPLTKDDVRGLIAWLKYTSSMNTEGWPPAPRVDGVSLRQAKSVPVAQQTAATSPDAASAGTQAAAAGAAAAPAAARGEALAREYGCVACHASDTRRLVGPGWGGLYGSTVALTDGSSVKADDAYLVESIVQPNAKTVAGFPSGTMVSYAEILDREQVDAIVAYIRSLGEKAQ